MLLKISSILATALLISSLAGALPNHEEGHVSANDNSTELDGKTADQASEANPNLNQVRYHPDAKKYVTIGSTEFCKENMRFFAVPNDERLGQCDCDYYRCTRPLLYSPKTGSCHVAWSQGPCGEGEWYTFTEALKPICEKNPCPESPATDGANYYFKRVGNEDGKCYQAGTKGYCGADEILMLHPSSPIPECRTGTVCNALTFPPSQVCMFGNRRHYDGLCDSELQKP